MSEREAPAWAELVVAKGRINALEADLEAANKQVETTLKLFSESNLKKTYDDLEAANIRATEAEAERDVLQRLAQVRADYALRCGDCGGAHFLDTSLPSDVWNQIADPADVLCTLCIDRRLETKALACDQAEFYYAGTALQSKLYTESHGVVAATERQRDDYLAGLREAVAALRERCRGCKARLPRLTPEGLVDYKYHDFGPEPLKELTDAMGYDLEDYERLARYQHCQLDGNEATTLASLESRFPALVEPTSQNAQEGT